MRLSVRPSVCPEPPRVTQMARILTILCFSLSREKTDVDEGKTNQNDDDVVIQVSCAALTPLDISTAVLIQSSLALRLSHTHISTLLLLRLLRVFHCR